MKDLSLFALDIAQNALSAGATQILLTLSEGADWTVLTVADNGRGMSPEFLAAVTDPFTTTRSTRKVGLGLPLLKEAAELTGGALVLESAPGAGTTVTARFMARHIDCVPVGDMGGTVALLMQGSPDLALRYTHVLSGRSFVFDTEEVRQVLGEGISLAEAEVALWVRDYVGEQEENLSGGEPPLRYTE